MSGLKVPATLPKQKQLTLPIRYKAGGGEGRSGRSEEEEKSCHYQKS